MQLSKHAGGGDRNRYIDTTIFIEQGDYLLRYKSNNSHCYNDWSCERPASSVYGILVFEENGQFGLTKK